jgi:glycerol-3-phosphate dehydrogenase
MAPHLVTPLPTVLPIYRGARRGPYVIRAGMLLYDTLSVGRSVPGHHMLGKSAVADHIPGLNEFGLRGGALYYDAQVTWAERLVIELAESAWRHGARIGTRLKVESLSLARGAVSGLTVRDMLGGQAHAIQARQIVNVAGPWVDDVLCGLPGYRPSHTLIGGTRGSHLIVRRWPGAPTDAIYFESHKDHRPILIVPWNGLILLGSTDVRHEGDPGHAVATADEIAYLLAETNSLISTANLTRADILYSYAGVRPLPWVASGETGSITRRHIIHDHAPEAAGLRSIIGGKLTTHRSLAEEVVDKVSRDLGNKARCTTADGPLPGAEGMAFPGQTEAVRQRLVDIGSDPALASRLVDIWGARSLAILSMAAEEPDLNRIVPGETPMLAAEIAFAIDHEAALTLTDVLMRRTMVGFGPTLAREQFRQVAAIMQSRLRWNQDERESWIGDHERWLGRLIPENEG